MSKCPNCGQRAQSDYCEWCGYPLLSGSYKKIPKTYRELKEERLPQQPVVEEAEPEMFPVYEAEPEPLLEPEPESILEVEPEAESKPEAVSEPISEPEPHLVGRGPLQMAGDARFRCGRAPDHRGRFGLGQIRRLGRNRSLHRPQSPLPLDPHGAERSFWYNR